LIRAQIPISAHDTNGLLREKLSRIGAQLLLEVLPRWVRGEIKTQTQNEALASYTRLISKEAGEIDWKRAAVEIWRQVRACQPWPGCFTHWQGKQLKIIETIPLDGEAGMPGRVIALKREAAFGVETGAGILGIVKVQLEGKRAMTADEFLRGQRQLIGAVLTGE
jgi:methionyl-tRNA formyltransferase